MGLKKLKKFAIYRMDEHGLLHFSFIYAASSLRAVTTDLGVSRDCVKELEVSSDVFRILDSCADQFEETDFLYLLDILRRFSYFY